MLYKAVLKNREERRLLRGHLWAFRNELTKTPDAPDGALVDLTSDQGRFIGRGFFQREGGIAVRLLTDKNEDVDQGFFSRRIARARRYRETLYPGESVYRWVFGESDGLPGLVADRYGSIVSLHTACAFYSDLAQAVAEPFLSSEGVTGVRLQAGSTVKRFGDVPPAVEVTSMGIRYNVRLDEGQKTGLFLDQRENCVANAALFAGARVLDAFCYAGQWGLHAARSGAAQVRCVDSSATAVEMATANTALNGLESQIVAHCEDVNEALRSGERYNVVVLDPPALAKSRAQSQKALGHYQALNRDAMAAVEPGGYLITSSCSHFVDSPMFIEMLKRAARSAQRAIWIVEERGAARDHPILLAMPETAYLKCLTLRVF